MAGERHLASLKESIVNLSSDTVVVNPRLFQRYFMLEWEKRGKALHRHGKLLAVHCDGRMAALKDLTWRLRWTSSRPCTRRRWASCR